MKAQKNKDKDRHNCFRVSHNNNDTVFFLHSPADAWSVSRSWYRGNPSLGRSCEPWLDAASSPRSPTSSKSPVSSPTRAWRCHQSNNQRPRFFCHPINQWTTTIFFYCHPINQQHRILIVIQSLNGHEWPFGQWTTTSRHPINERPRNAIQSMNDHKLPFNQRTATNNHPVNDQQSHPQGTSKTRKRNKYYHYQQQTAQRPCFKQRKTHTWHSNAI